MVLTGQNWQGDATVRVFTNDHVFSSWNRNVYVSVAADGTITDSFNLPNWFVADYSVVATGLQTGRVATTTFTDAAPPSNENLWQCDPPTGFNPATYTCVTSGNDGWSTGNNNGPYSEGDTVPYRTRFQNLVIGTDYSVEIQWDTTKHSKHAIDYLKSVQRDDPIGQSVLVAEWASRWACAVVRRYVADPSRHVHVRRTRTGSPTTAVATRIPASSRCSAATSPSTSVYTTPANYTGDTSTSITVFFTATSTDAVLAWGGHIASRQDWGPDSSAVSISGSPYHMRSTDSGR